jgi:hypothetical protein
VERKDWGLPQGPVLDEKERWLVFVPQLSPWLCSVLGNVLQLTRSEIL